MKAHTIETHSLAKWWEHEQCNHPLILFAKCFVWYATWAFARSASTRTHTQLSFSSTLSPVCISFCYFLSIIVRPMELALCVSVSVFGAVDLLFIAHTRAHSHTHILLPIVTRPKSSKVVNLINYWQTVIITVATKVKCACPQCSDITHHIVPSSPLMKIYYHIKWPRE